MINEEWKEAYGQYDIPKEVLLLHQLENELSNEGLSLSHIAFQPIDQFGSYSITPPDLIPFASTGGDGIHFGFLTDFQSVSNLSEAPIVCVSPTNDPPLRYMARNIREFLNLVYSVPYAELLESIWNYDDEKQVMELVKEFEQYSSSTWEENQKYILTRFQQVFGTKQMEVLSYFKEVMKERAESIQMSTLDGLGVIYTDTSIQSKQHFKFPVNHSCDEAEVMKMQSFLVQSNELEKLAFVRDANYWFVVTSDYDEAVWELVLELLKLLNLQDEAKRVYEKC